MNQEKIGKFIAEMRKEKNLTQEDLASKIGITKNAVSKWERGISMMDMSLLIPVCDILDISITELLNGERIENENLKEQTDKAIKNTLDYTDKKIHKNKIKNIIGTVFIIIFIVCFLFFGYKFYLLRKYTAEKIEDYQKVVNGLNTQKEIRVYKRTIPDSDYLVVDHFKIRNDYKDFELQDRNNDMEPIVYKNENTVIQFSTEKYGYLMIDLFASEDASFYGTGASRIEKKFNAADRKYFLLKNDINNDVDFYQYIAKNYYKKNTLFMSRREMMENFAFNTFVNVAVPLVKSITYIKGDYEGYIFQSGNDEKSVWEVNIHRDGKRYGFVTNDSRFLDEEYIIDLLGTIDIR